MHKALVFSNRSACWTCAANGQVCKENCTTEYVFLPGKMFQCAFEFGFVTAINTFSIQRDLMTCHTLNLRTAVIQLVKQLFYYNNRRFCGDSSFYMLEQDTET